MAYEWLKKKMMNLQLPSSNLHDLVKRHRRRISYAWLSVFVCFRYYCTFYDMSGAYKLAIRQLHKNNNN